MAADFLERFRGDYADFWTGENLGAASTAMLIDMARKLGICTDAMALTDPAFVRRFMQPGAVDWLRYSGAILTTEKADHSLLSTEQFAPHCLLVTSGSNNLWTLRDPEPDGRMIDRTWDNLKVHEKSSHFLLFFCRIP